MRKILFFLFLLVSVHNCNANMCEGCGCECDLHDIKNDGKKVADQNKLNQGKLGLQLGGGLFFTPLTIVDLVNSGQFDSWLTTKDNPGELCIILYMCFKYSLWEQFRKVLKNPFFQQFPLYTVHFDDSVMLCPLCGKSANEAINELVLALPSLNMSYFVPRH